MTSLLEQIQSPKDLQALNEKELTMLAQEIRQFLVTSVSKTGGHLASNLGVVELTLALHQVYDTFQDKIIWDVGHQTYVHKLLTGRLQTFHTLRQYGGISGFPKRHESLHDHFNTGHSATSISAALGMATARDLKGEKHQIAAVIGDGAMTGGMAFEALNHAGQSHLDLTVVLNDNKMSIARNVGGLSNYLTRIRTMPVYSRLKEDLEHLMDHFAIGKSFYRTAEKAKDSIKYFFVPGVLFEELGFTYIGPIDGHQIHDLKEAFRLARRIGGPKLVHVMTVKGKGYGPAEKFPAKFHGIGTFDPETGKTPLLTRTPSFSQIAGSTLESLAESDPRVVAITAAMPDGTGLTNFEHRFPHRFFDVGIAEQHAVTFAAGQAAAGLRPFFAVYSSFLQRGYDQLIHDVCLQNLPVTFLVDRAGLVGNDGETHHGVFDISCLSAIPNLTILSPADGTELSDMMRYSLELNSPVLIRYPRGEAHALTVKREPIQYGKGSVLQVDGNDYLIIALGTMVHRALEVLNQTAKDGLFGQIINPRFVKPLDHTLLLRHGQQVRQVYVLEENQQIGGLGRQVQALYQENQLTCPVHTLGLPDNFTPQGDMNHLYQHLELTVEKLVQRIHKDSSQTSRQPHKVVSMNLTEKRSYGKTAN
ncbi:1-deoxy-D-xylulose-5-phosphate synthase [Anoxynatronum buryatiense]|uniref:1-deoxy-D-xylulose-5-phosphate synthase n=1 Tax=Anoxynatronum buryatiense TaxID=489973 RepID=A0AA45WUJ9_9CLOT|nr:1-deoxy-D-xylulose-5-phosphate synthase [Anoxynatronum buryatiense]SMP48441.1 1-deoxy-D-xylulose-5-phosphate synthase [Anoxynatronum buryatiense]